MRCSGVEADGREIQANLYQVVSVPATKSVTWKKTPDVTPPASPVLDKSGWHGMQDEEKDTPPDTPATQDAEGTVNTVLKLAAVARSKLEDIKEFVPAKTPSSSTTVPVREGKLSAKAVSFTPQKPAQSTSPTPTTTSFETISTPGVQAAHPRANGLVASVPSPQSTFISAIAMTPRSYNNHYGILHNSALVYNPVALPWLDTSTPDDLFTNCEVANGKEVTELPFELAEFCQTLHMAGIKNVVDLRITVPDSSSVDAFVAEVSKEIPSQLANFAARFRLKQAIRSVLKY